MKYLIEIKTLSIVKPYFILYRHTYINHYRTISCLNIENKTKLYSLSSFLWRYFTHSTFQIRDWSLISIFLLFSRITRTAVAYPLHYVLTPKASSFTGLTKIMRWTYWTSPQYEMCVRGSMQKSQRWEILFIIFFLLPKQSLIF